MPKAFKDLSTTIPGVVSAFFAFVAVSSNALHWPQWVVLLAAFCASGGFAALGINARSQGQHDTDAKEMAEAVQADIKSRLARREVS